VEGGLTDEHRALAITGGARMIWMSAFTLAQATDLACVKVRGRCRHSPPHADNQVKRIMVGLRGAVCRLGDIVGTDIPEGVWQARASQTGP
jgi:hypothetical protein